MNKCQTCNTIMLDSIKLESLHKPICVNCTNTPLTEVVNASSIYNLPVRDNQDVVIPDPKSMQLPKIEFINEDMMQTDSAKPDFTQITKISSVDSKPVIEDTKVIQEPKNNKDKIWVDWSDVIGYEEIKFVIDSALNSTNKKKTHILITGEAGTSKTVFLLTVKESLEQQGIKVFYVDASTMSSSGIIEFLFMNDIDNSILEIDEIDKMAKEHQSVLLNMLESGMLQETKSSPGKNKSQRIRSKETHSVLCLATGNYLKKIMNPLLTRFMNFQIPEYTKEQFYNIGVKLLEGKKYNKTEENAQYIVKSIWDIYTKQGIKPNLRFARQVAEITNNDRTNIDKVLNAQKKYSKNVEVS